MKKKYEGSATERFIVCINGQFDPIIINGKRLQLRETLFVKITKKKSYLSKNRQKNAERTGMKKKTIFFFIKPRDN